MRSTCPSCRTLRSTSEVPVQKIKTIVIKPPVFVGKVLSGSIVEDEVAITLNLNFHTEMTAGPAPDRLYHLLSLSPPTIFLRLKPLRDASFVTTLKAGNCICYQLRRDKFYGLGKQLVQYLNYEDTGRDQNAALSRTASSQ